MIRNVTYQLNLLEELCIHNVFYVSLLCNHKPRAGEDTPEPEPLCLAEDPAKKEWAVEAITALQIVDSPEGKPVLQYQIV